MNKELAIRILSGEVLGTNEQTHEAVLMAIKALVEAEPVRHGKWKLTEELMGWEDVSCAECSMCGESFVLGDYDMDDIRAEFKFCPNCGATMDLDEVDE